MKKKKKQQYGRESYKNLSEDEKQKLQKKILQNEKKMPNYNFKKL